MLYHKVSFPSGHCMHHVSLLLFLLNLSSFELQDLPQIQNSLQAGVSVQWYYVAYYLQMSISMLGVI